MFLYPEFESVMGLDKLLLAFFEGFLYPFTFCDIFYEMPPPDPKKEKIGL